MGVFRAEQALEEVEEMLQTIEKDLKKNPPFRFGPRTIDIDILLCGERIVDSDTLTIPHPKLHTRRFVLEPLQELLEDNFLHPVRQETLKTMSERVHDQACTRIDMTL